jgi:hypothetical protein
MDVTVVVANLDTLRTFGRPAILHVNENHFIAFLDDRDGRLLLFDNGVGLFECAPDSFAEKYNWNGACLIFQPPRVSFFLASNRRWIIVAIACLCFVVAVWPLARRRWQISKFARGVAT